MGNFKCYSVDNPNTVWSYCPSFGAAILFCVLFGLITVIHTIQAVSFRKPFAIVLIMGGIWESVGYAFRILSVMHQLNSGYFSAQYLLILLAPLWINAFVYMVLSRAIHFFLDDDRVFSLRARRITKLFVLSDIVSFIVQATGGSMSASQGSQNTTRLGLHVYMIGVGIQLFFNCLFLILALRFQELLRTLPTWDLRLNALSLLKIVYAVLGLIIFRNIYRLVEYSFGATSTLTTHEWYAYVLDALPMLFSMLALSVRHPSQVLQGTRSDFSEENKAIKQAKAQKKAAKRAARKKHADQM
ncbi:RTA1 like protein-domain-containing protein [Xylogone sp. PMI_703]|nr:RTA1 like protein-domain-containing protein [Xylogone sp. PMI_703]